MLIAFRQHRLFAEGDEAAIRAAMKRARSAGGDILVFEAATGRQRDIDLREPEPAAEERGPGRPKLGVVAREVTLLPRHWEWLSVQPGGGSAALRRLVDEARMKPLTGAASAKARAEAAYRFLSAIAGDLPAYEEALRALFRQDRTEFLSLTKPWPPDIARIAKQLAWPR